MQEEPSPTSWVPFVGPAIASWQARKARAQSPRQVLVRQQASRWLAVWAVTHIALSVGSQQVGGGAWHLRLLYLDGLATTGYLCLCFLALYRLRRSRQHLCSDASKPWDKQKLG